MNAFSSDEWFFTCRFSRLSAIVVLLVAATGAAQAAETPPSGGVTATVGQLDAAVFSPEQAKTQGLRAMLAKDLEARLRAASERETKAWRAVQTWTEWQRFRDQRIAALRTALGQFPAAAPELNVRVTARTGGDGFRIEHLVFESRPGLIVTAHLYLPAEPAASMPGILLSHSHHNPKSQGELQDMGMTWARQGCLVLVMDHVGHGERRQHPFVQASQFPRSFRVGRQDYFFRFNTALQLEVIGDSLLGWMVWDLQRGVDLLLSRPGIDPRRILAIGAVAGGGDPAGVAAALDPRITAVAPFNFGGPQPDYAIPADENEFYWFGVPYWETTRALRGSARDGFAQWLIVASVAPRQLMYCHEFAWDRARDPAWPRLQRVFELAGVPDHLATATGRGHLQGSPPESSHCNNVGTVHRAPMYPVLQRWFELPVPEKEIQNRRPDAELTCLTPAIKPRPLHELAGELGRQRSEAARRERAGLTPDAARQRLRALWAERLGAIEPKAKPAVVAHRQQQTGGATVEWIALEVEPRIVVPLVLLRPAPLPKEPLPIVIGVAQHGKQAFLEQRTEAIAELLAGGMAVCLPDLRGTGETAVSGRTDFRGDATSRSQAEWLLAQTLLGSRLRDLRSVLRYLQSRPELDGTRLGLWGDSFAPANAPDQDVRVPLDLADSIPHAEPLGGMLAILGMLYEDGVRAAAVGGGLASYASLLESPFCYVPHDAVVPGALVAGDFDDLTAVLAPRPVRWERAVDARNRALPSDQLEAVFGLARKSYAARDAAERLVLAAPGQDGQSAAHWLREELRQPGVEQRR